MRFALMLLVACGAARPVSPKSGTPCFPERASLEAREMYAALEKHAQSLYASADEPPVPDAMYGVCKVSRNVVRAPDGKVVAELGCGVRILVGGIRDDLGLQLGARGEDVMERKKKPVPELRCLPNGPAHARCAFEREPGSDTDSSWYVVAGALPTAKRGDEAVAFFRASVITEITYSAWCH